LTHPPDRPDIDAALDRILRRLAPGALDRVLRGPGPADEASTSGVCLDAETVAAMVDGGLLPHARTAAEAHASTCARCQALIAVMIRTTPEPAPRRAWWQMPSLRWAAPLVATGLAVAVWVAVGVRQPSVAPMSVPATVPAPERKALPSVQAPADARRDLQEGRQAQFTPDAAREEAPKELGQSTPAKRERSDKPAPLDQLAQLASAKQKEVVPAEKSTAAKASATVPGLPPAQELPAVTSNVPAPVSPPAPVAEGVRGGASNAFRADALADRAAVVGQLEKVTVTIADIVSPNPRSRWRILGASVQRSIDEGATWTTQVDLKTARLTAGSAPQSDICWIVGDDGIVLITVDGLSWQFITAPARTGLVSVRAASADAATVTTSDGRTFATTDRGRTWAPR
jgi:hypothetical protein